METQQVEGSEVGGGGGGGIGRNSRWLHAIGRNSHGSMPWLHGSTPLLDGLVRPWVNFRAKIAVVAVAVDVAVSVDVLLSLFALASVCAWDLLGRSQGSCR